MLYANFKVELIPHKDTLKVLVDIFEKNLVS